MKHALLIVIVALGLMAADETAPTYKGLVCMGWVKPDAQAMAEGDSTGDELVVNTSLTESEKDQLYYARKEFDAVSHRLNDTESLILAHHHLLYPLSDGSDWMREGPCGDRPMIRWDEYHITQFVPSNPKYPSDKGVLMTMRHDDPAKCRDYFAKMREHAVKALYGSEASDKYVPRGR